MLNWNFGTRDSIISKFTLFLNQWKDYIFLKLINNNNLFSFKGYNKNFN